VVLTCSGFTRALVGSFAMLAPSENNQTIADFSRRESAAFFLNGREVSARGV
jgi:hypothetical protein